MLINGIRMNGMPPSFGGATKTTKTGDKCKVDLQEKKAGRYVI